MSERKKLGDRARKQMSTNPLNSTNISEENIFNLEDENDDLIKENNKLQYALQEYAKTGYEQSHNLEELEKGITQDYLSSLKFTFRMCLALYQIKKRGLYKKLAGSFKEYLKQERLKLPKSTISEYALIGEALTKYKEDLKRIQYTQDDGKTKLVLLARNEKKINDFEDKRIAIFDQIKKLNHRQFDDYLSDLVNNKKNEKVIGKEPEFFFEGVGYSVSKLKSLIKEKTAIDPELKPYIVFSKDPPEERG